MKVYFWKPHQNLELLIFWACTVLFSLDIDKYFSELSYQFSFIEGKYVVSIYGWPELLLASFGFQILFYSENGEMLVYQHGYDIFSLFKSGRDLGGKQEACLMTGILRELTAATRAGFYRELERHRLWWTGEVVCNYCKVTAGAQVSLERTGGSEDDTCSLLSWVEWSLESEWLTYY